MSRAAKQCRIWVEAEYPGVRIGRKACRDTASNYISQHSSYDYGEYDSNAMDIRGPEALPYDEERAFVHEIVVALQEYADEWSINQILWNVPNHYGHAHVDFSPMCATHRWCGRDVAVRWRLSNGATFSSHDPDPENGEYGGPEMTYTHFKVGEERAEWEPVVWWLYMLEGGDIDANDNSAQVSSKLSWKTNVRLVQVEDFDLIAEKISLSNANRIAMEDGGLYRFGKELAELRQITYT